MIFGLAFVAFSSADNPGTKNFQHGYIDPSVEQDKQQAAPIIRENGFANLAPVKPSRFDRAASYVPSVDALKPPSGVNAKVQLPPGGILTKRPPFGVNENIAKPPIGVNAKVQPPPGVNAARPPFGVNEKK